MSNKQRDVRPHGVSEIPQALYFAFTQIRECIATYAKPPLKYRICKCKMEREWDIILKWCINLGYIRNCLPIYSLHIYVSLTALMKYSKTSSILSFDIET